MAAKIFRVNYKSDFILTLTSDAGWTTPFCIKFWTGEPALAYYAGWDGETYTHCAYNPAEPTKLVVQFDDHHLPVGDLKFQIGYHFTVADFPNDTEDEVINPASIVTEINGEEYQVMLDFTGETAPEIEFALPAYANEQQRIANEQQREQEFAQMQQDFSQMQQESREATEGAENVNAQLNGTTLTVTNRQGVSTSKSVQGPQGEKGDKGDTGPQGPQGSQGPAATIAVGTTTTGAPGTPAKVTNSGTSGAAVLDFIIPQGAKGDKGDKGDTGEVTEEELEAVVDGTRPVALANNLTSWAERGTLPTEDEWEGVVRTSGGDLSIVSNQGAELISIKAGAGQFKATALKATGFNLLHDAVAVGTGYYFLVPKLVFGTFGTAEEANGVLFTDNNNDNLKPTVYFKPLSGGVPTSVTDGSACTYTDSNGYRFYTTPQAGYLIVSGITFADTCAHIAWSMRYDEFISPTDAADAGSSVALTSVIAAIHNYGHMIGVMSAGVLVGDTIERISATAVKWTRNCDRVVPTWTNTDNGDETYTHTATITAMKANGGAALDGKVLTVTGQSVSYADDAATGSTDYVRYELATPATGTASLTTHLNIEDFGLEEFTGAEGSAVVKMQYYANYADILALIAQLKMAVAVKDIASNKARVEHAELEIAASQEYDLPGLPTMQGQPMKLFGAGTPQEAIVPDNWIQFADGGFDWNGLPSTLGQEYINTSVNSAGHYTAVRDGNNLKWVNS